VGGGGGECKGEVKNRGIKTGRVRVGVEGGRGGGGVGGGEGKGERRGGGLGGLYRRQGDEKTKQGIGNSWPGLVKFQKFWPRRKVQFGGKMEGGKGQDGLTKFNSKRKVGGRKASVQQAPAPVKGVPQGKNGRRGRKAQTWESTISNHPEVNQKSQNGETSPRDKRRGKPGQGKTGRKNKEGTDP